MKSKILFLLIMITIFSNISLHAQRQKNIRIGYIDTEYILQNIPEYTKAKTKLENNVKSWKFEIEKRLSNLAQKRKALQNEKALLTQELFKEREDTLNKEEEEIMEYQQKRFGPDGDLVIQKRQLINPIKSKIFKAVESISAAKKYDFVFDKSTDVVLLYSAERFNISDQVLRRITRTSKQ